jgi:hypothetical protein
VLHWFNRRVRVPRLRVTVEGIEFLTNVYFTWHLIEYVVWMAISTLTLTIFLSMVAIISE